MGGAVSSGRDNNELVDNLCYESYIHTPEVERVFRQVDRAHFMTFTEEDDDCLEAYEDHAWRKGTLHLSAPCIYTRAMEALQLKPGVSFLNVGSGTGYFSTMVGLLIGPYGINHGIEIYQENVEFAHQKQEEFLEHFTWYDPLHFCEPLFVVGNGLLLSPGNLLYDRIYCGAACPPEHAQLMKNMLAVGGILVMPHDNQLESVCRVSETEWKESVVLPSVSFAPLILPSQESVKDLEALEIAVQPLSLKQSCRLRILKELGRERYCRISELPLPQFLKEYVSYYKEWGPPSTPVKTLCPIDLTQRTAGSSSDDDSGQPKSKNADSRQNGGAPGQHGRAMGWGNERGGGRSGRGRREGGSPYAAQSMNINGRRVLICNVSGIFIQIPLDSDDEGSGEGGYRSSGDEAEAPSDIIFDESADEATEDSDLLTAEGSSSDMLVPENSMSEDGSSMVDTTATTNASSGGDNVSMEDLAAIAEELGDDSGSKEGERGVMERQTEEPDVTKIESKTTTIGNNGVSKRDELSARTIQ